MVTHLKFLFTLWSAQTWNKKIWSIVDACCAIFQEQARSLKLQPFLCRTPSAMIWISGNEMGNAQRSLHFNQEEIGYHVELCNKLTNWHFSFLANYHCFIFQIEMASWSESSHKKVIMVITLTFHKSKCHLLSNYWHKNYCQLYH